MATALSHTHWNLKNQTKSLLNRYQRHAVIGACKYPKPSYLTQEPKVGSEGLEMKTYELQEINLVLNENQLGTLLSVFNTGLIHYNLGSRNDITEVREILVDALQQVIHVVK